MPPPITGLPSLLRVLWRRKGMILLLTALVGGGVAGLSRFTPPQYRAKASVLVKLGREFVVRPEVDGERATTMFRLQEMINTEIVLLESQDLADRIVQRFGAAALFPELLEADEPLSPELLDAHAVSMVREAMSITAVTESSAIEVAFTHLQSETSAAVANALVEEFQRKHLQVFGTTRVEFIETDALKLGVELKAAEDALLLYRTEHGIWNPDEQEVQLVRRRSDLARRRAEIDSGLHGTERVRTTEAARSQLLQAQFAEQELLTKYLPESRAVKAAHQATEIAAKQLLDLQQQTAAQVAGQIESLDGEVKRIDTELQLLAAGRRQLRELERKQVQLTEQFDAASRRLTSAQEAARLDQEGAISVSVIDAARPPLKPLGLSVPKRIALGVVAGFLFAVAMALVLHRLSMPAQPESRHHVSPPQGRQPRRRQARAPQA